MTGPEHYAEAERLLTEPDGWYPGTVVRGDMLAQAQVHATLAHAAAVIETAASRGPGDVGSDWRTALSIPEPPYHSPDLMGPG